MSFLTGTFAKIVSIFIETRQKKMEAKIEQEKEDRRHKNTMEVHYQAFLMEKEIKETELNIEQEKTRRDELTNIRKQIEAIKENVNNIINADKELYGKASNFVVNLLLLMKPIITIIMLVGFISLLIFSFKVMFVQDKNIDNYLQIMTILKDVGVFTFMEGAIGFWFGFASVSAIRK